MSTLGDLTPSAKFFLIIFFFRRKFKKPLKLDRDLFIDFALIPFRYRYDIKSLTTLLSTEEISLIFVFSQKEINDFKSLL